MGSQRDILCHPWEGWGAQWLVTGENILSGSRPSVRRCSGEGTGIPTTHTHSSLADPPCCLSRGELALGPGAPRKPPWALVAGKSFQGAVLRDRVGICRSYLSMRQGNKVALTPACLSYRMDHSVSHGSWGLSFLSCKLRKQSSSACPDWSQWGLLRQGVCQSFVSGDMFFSFVNRGMCFCEGGSVCVRV